MATARELTWKIGWQINDSPIKQADQKTDELGRKVKDVGKETESLKQKSATGFGGMFASIKQGIGIFAGVNIGSQITNMFSSGIKAGWDFNSSMQQSTASFETLLGSTEKAKSMLADLTDFAAKTPFEMGDLNKASQTLLSFGIDANKIMPDIKMLGDVSLGNKEKLQSLTLAFAQIQSTGRLMGQDLLQLINGGFNPLQIISEKTGTSMGDLKKAMEDGQISADMVTQAFKDATSAGGRFYGGMDKMSKTFEGQMSTLKDNAKQTLGKVMAPAFNYVSDNILPKVIDKLNIFSDTFVKTGDVGKSFGKTMDSVFGAGTFDVIQKNVMPVFDVIKDSLGFMVEQGKIIYNALSTPLLELATQVMPVFAKAFDTYSQQILPALKRIESGFIQFLLPQIQKVFAVIHDVIMPPFIKVFSFVADTIVPKLVSSFEKWMPYIQNIIGGVIDFIIQYVKVFMNVFQFVWPYISDIVTIAVDTIGTVIGGILRVLSGIIDFITGVFTGDWSRAWEGVKNIFAGIFDGIGGILKGTINLIIAGINEMVRGVNGIEVTMPSWVPVVGGKKIGGLGIPEIPAFASGVNNFSGGPAWINDGPGGGELAIMPNGSSVIPSDKTNMLLSGGSSGVGSVNIEVNVNVAGGSNAQETGQTIANATKQAIYDAIEDFFYDLSLKNTAQVVR